MTAEELLLQAQILADKTDVATNPNMTSNAVASKNKALNSKYFTGDQTRIVNAINNTYKQADKAIDTVAASKKTMASILGDAETTEGVAKWAALQEKMGFTNLIDGLTDLYDNKLTTAETATVEELTAMYNNIKAGTTGA